MTTVFRSYEALKAVTINGAEKIGLQEEIGSIEENKLADLLILESDPLETIFNSTDILYTIQNGNVYTAEDVKYILSKRVKIGRAHVCTLVHDDGLPIL